VVFVDEANRISHQGADPSLAPVGDLISGALIRR
jgi:hypothetical protein